ncbi:MAG: UvrD-helicase domain-containing protein [Candidatus Peregrinibacteria bacterium]
MPVTQKKPAKHPKTDLIMEGLNEPQKQAVSHTKGPLLILAGAGSGKTRAITHRIARLMRDGVKSWQILAVTFTNKAAGEMKSRVANLLHILEPTTPLDMSSQLKAHSSKLPVMGTFHAICARILRRDIEHLGRDRSFVIYDADDQERLIKHVLKELAIEESTLKPRAALSYIGRFKSEAVSPLQAMKDATTERMEKIIRAYRHYQKLLAEANALDFDDIILETVRLFTEIPAVLSRYQETWQYLHVDEYQDTNHAQYLFITLLAQKYKNLCVIGDPDQSIYAFRGADVRNILEFERDYPAARRIKLEQNYRSTQLILTAADTVIAANPNRPEKSMWSERRTGPKVLVHEVADERKEAEEAVREAERLRAGGVRFSDQVILYRTNAQSRLFEETCMRFAVPYRIVGGVKFYARSEVKDILAYLAVVLNPLDTLSLLRIINVPARKIGFTTLGKIQEFGSAHGLPLWDCLHDVARISDLPEATQKRITDFVSLMSDLRACAETETASALAEKLLKRIGMATWLKDGTEEGDGRWENVQELLSVMHKYDALAPRESLVSFLEEVALVSEVDNLQDAKDDALTLMTLHLCKGLEFEHVTIAGCEDGLFPHASSLFDREQLEEERRLLYVGMTRAKTHLTLLFARQRMLFGNVAQNAPSRFLDDLPDAVIERRSDDLLSAFAWASGRGSERVTQGETTPSQTIASDIAIEFNQDAPLGTEDANQEAFEEHARVGHPVFGAGTILARRGDIVEIAFDSGKKKSFVLSIAPLKLL